MRHSPQSPADRSLPLHAAAAWSLLFLHLTLSPLLLSRTTHETFEEPKALLLTLTALLLAGLALSAWALRPASVLALVYGWLRDPVCLGLLLLTASAAASTVGSLSPRVSWRGAPDSHFGLATLLGYLVLFLATRSLCRSVPQGRRLLGAVAVAAPLASAYALAQVTGWDPLSWEGTTFFADQVRPGSTLGHPNYLGAYLVTALPLLLAAAARAGRTGRWLGVAIRGGGVLLAGVVIVLTLSRAAWLAGAASVVVLLIGAGWALRRQAAVALGGGVLLLGGVGAVGLCGPWLSEEQRQALTDRVHRLGDGEGRWHIWRAAWDEFRERPLLGCGPDAFRLAFGAHRPVGYHEVEPDATPSRAHNEVLHVLATQGILGGLSVLLLLFGLTRAACRAWRTQPEERLVVLGAAAGVLAFLVQSLFGFTVIGCGTLFVTLAALLSAWSEAAPDQDRLTIRSQRPAPRWRYLLQGGVAVGVCAAVMAGVVRPYQASACRQEGERLAQTAPEEATARYRQALTLDEGNDECWMRLGAAALLAGRQAPTLTEQRHYFDLARRAFERAVALVPVDPYHHANLARALGELACRGLAAPADARREWDVALEADPNNARFLAEAARTALAVGDPVRARRLAAHGVAVYPRCALVRTQLGNCAFAEGHFTDALALLRQAIDLEWGENAEEKTRALATIAAVYLALGQPEQAQAFARLASERWPHWSTPHLLLAQALERLGERAKACGEYRQVLSLVPDDPNATAALRRLETGG
jgi:O-antigen ligase/tetratricopeptide (TPR) repeat protein